MEGLVPLLSFIYSFSDTSFPKITFKGPFSRSSKWLYRHLTWAASREYMKVLPRSFDMPLEVVFTTDKLEEEGLLAGAIPNYIRCGVTDKPSQIEAYGYAGMIAHELAHEVIRRHYERSEPDRCYRLCWNLVHFAVYDRWGSLDYLYTKELKSRPRLVVGYPVRMTLVDVGKLIKDQNKLSLPKPDGRYYV